MLPSEQMIDSVCTPNPVPENLKDGQVWATHSGTLEIGEIKLGCHILSTGERVFDADDIEKNLIQIRSIFSTDKDAYSKLFDFFYEEHGLTLLHGEMDDIINAVDQFKKDYNQ